MAKKLPRGRPADAKLDEDSIKNKVNFELLKAQRDAANNMAEYYKILNEYALGKKGSSTNQLSAIREMIEFAKECLEDKSDEIPVADRPAEDKKKASPVISLISTEFDEKTG